MPPPGIFKGSPTKSASALPRFSYRLFAYSYCSSLLSRTFSRSAMGTEVGSISAEDIS